ncbi:hypothetical protein [Leptospira hartskeerlii]|nr:hypothetical protein [Leptospira hartskeerlii]
MRYILVFSILAFFTFGVFAGDRDKGDSCTSDIQCGFGLQCTGGVCTKKPEFDHGSSGKSGKQCNHDGDCIGSGKCVSGSFGKKYCSGN